MRSRPPLSPGAQRNRINKLTRLAPGAGTLISSSNISRCLFSSSCLTPSHLSCRQHDVGGLVDIRFPFEAEQIRVIVKQLFEVSSVAISLSSSLFVSLTLTLCSTSLCQVLAFLHEKGILHRDIKTSNLLLSDRLQVPHSLAPSRPPSSSHPTRLFSSSSQTSGSPGRSSPSPRLWRCVGSTALRSPPP
jgi:serine/threonine protein kinase